MAPKKNVAGGRAYDAVIGACAEQGKASTVLTFNAVDFMALGQNFEVVVPGTGVVLNNEMDDFSVDSTTAKATFKDGMLELKLPKIATSQRHTVKVE